MCGINGLLYFDPLRGVAEHDLRRMSAVARHRGPDDSGVYIDGRVGFAFNRLSIIDLAGGHQPMSNEDGSVWVIFNGEIYNFQSLRSELLARGHRFRTRSDTEVIVHAWEEYGERCVEKLRGMFGFAIWDARQQILFAARDRLGIKPFYYFQNKECFAFASEMKSLLELPFVSTEIHPGALEEFLRRRYVIAPNTVLRDVRKLEPGHTVTIAGDRVQVRRYWDAPVDQREDLSDAQALEELDELLQECVKMHLVADVPLGVFLSGGLDSSCVVALMSKMGVQDIKTFSIGYDSAESELGYAKIVADHFRTDHHEHRLSPTGFQDALPKITWHMDEPVGDRASIPLFYLAGAARQEVTVALSGEGSDEIFGGYEIYQRMLQFEGFNRMPMARQVGRALAAVAGDTKVRKYAEMLGQPLEWRYGGVGALFSREQARRLLATQAETIDGVEQAYARFRNPDTLRRMSYVDLTTWLPDDLLVKADRMTMAHSLELRVPFLDHVLVEFATRLPGRFKIRGGVQKFLLKRWAEQALPREIVHRPKKGFPVPIKTWFRKDLGSFARETLSASDGICRQYLEAAEIERVFAAHQIEDRSEQIYSLLVLDSWHRQLPGKGSAVSSAYAPASL